MSEALFESAKYWKLRAECEHAERTGSPVSWRLVEDVLDEMRAAIAAVQASPNVIEQKPSGDSVAGDVPLFRWYLCICDRCRGALLVEATSQGLAHETAWKMHACNIIACAYPCDSEAAARRLAKEMGFSIQARLTQVGGSERSPNVTQESDKNVARTTDGGKL